MNLDNAVVSKDLLKDVVKNIEYNKTIIEYYDRFSQQGSITFNPNVLRRVSDRISSCNKFWQMDMYKQQKIKDFKKTNLCTDKFCSNCKKVKQAGRMAKYIPALEPYKDKLYHLTLTVPNCSGQDIQRTYKKMAKSFKMLINYLNGHNKIKGLDLSSWNYEGAIRSLECTFRIRDYHPHFHVCLAMEHTQSDRLHINKFSYDYRKGYGELKRMFTDEEVLIQKIWYLLNNDIKVTAASIEELQEGYSCTMDKFQNNDYAELFKYMTKETDEDGNVLSYDNFISLYYGFYRVKQIQGYGCFYMINDDVDLDSLQEQYDIFMEEIRAKENPELVYQTPQDLLNDNEYTLISRKNYFKYLQSNL